MNMLKINDNVFLMGGDLKAWGGSKHGQVLRQIERDDFHVLNFDDEYDIYRVQSALKHNGVITKYVYPFLAPKGYVYEEGSDYHNEIAREVSLPLNLLKKKWVEMSTWINCKEKLPKIKEYVLTYSDFGARQVGARFLSKDYPDLKLESDWFWGIQDQYGKAEDITHWQPLPEPPEK